VLFRSGEIVRTLRRTVPNFSLAVDADSRFDNPYGLSLVPIVEWYGERIVRRTVNGVPYDAAFRVPRPRTMTRLLAQQPDVLITVEFTGISVLATALTVFRRRRVGRVLLVESDPTTRGGARHGLVRAVKRWVVDRADVVQTNNEQGRRYLVEDLRARPERVRVAPYLTSRPPGPATNLTSAVDGKVRLLFVNSLSERKGVNHFLRALALVSDETARSLRVTIVGDGPERCRLEILAEDLGLTTVVSFAGRRNYRDLASYYADADVLVVPSMSDYRSLAGFEGLSYGLALLSSIFDGASAETVIDGQTGFAIDPTDHDAFAGKIEALVGNRDLLRRCRKGAAQLWDSKYSVERVAANLTASVECANRCARSADRAGAKTVHLELTTGHPTGPGVSR